MKRWYIIRGQSCTFSSFKGCPDLQDLRETFKALDANGDGFLTVTELRDGIDKAGMERWMQWMEMDDHVDTS